MNPIIHAKEGKVQAQLVYPQKNVAAMIAGRLSKSKKIPYVVTKIATGFEVHPEVVVSPAKPALKAVTNFMVQAANAMAAMDKAGLMHGDMGVLGTMSGKGSLFTIVMPVKSISKDWIHARHEGKPFWVAKSSLADWHPFSSGTQVKLVMTNAYAKKRGLI